MAGESPSSPVTFVHAASPVRPLVLIHDSMSILPLTIPFSERHTDLDRGLTSSTLPLETEWVKGEGRDDSPRGVRGLSQPRC